MTNLIQSTTFEISLIISFLLLGLLGFFAFRRDATISQFFLENGQIKNRGLVTSTLLATNLSLGNFIFILPVFGYFAGFGALWLVLLINLLAPLGFWVGSNKFKSFIEDNTNSGTVHQFIANWSDTNNGSSTYKLIRFAASIATVTGLIFALVLELNFTSRVFEDIFHKNAIIVFGSMIVMICFYTALGGFRAVLTTDRIQTITQVIGTVVLISFLIWLFKYSEYSQNLTWQNIHSSYAVSMKDHLMLPGLPLISGFVLVGFGWAIVGMDNWQRCCATRELDLSLSSVWIGFICVAILALLWTSLGIAIRLCVDPMAAQIGTSYMPDANPVLKLFSLSGDIGFWGSIGLGLLAMSLVMAGLSTADTFLTVSTHSLVSDIFMSSKNKDYGDIELNESKRITWIARALIFIIGLIALFLWILTKDLDIVVNNAADLFFSVYAVQYALLAPLLYIIFCKKPPSGISVLIAILASIILSLIVGYIGLSALINQQDSSLFGFYPADLLALSPLASTVLGTFILMSLNIFKRQ